MDSRGHRLGNGLDQGLRRTLGVVVPQVHRDTESALSILGIVVSALKRTLRRRTPAALPAQELLVHAPRKVTNLVVEPE